MQLGRKAKNETSKIKEKVTTQILYFTLADEAGAAKASATSPPHPSETAPVLKPQVVFFLLRKWSGWCWLLFV